jgi:LPXTG-motif cell wall-anchored protein
MSEDETMIRQLMVAWRDLYNTGNVSSTARALIKGASGGWNLNIQRSPVTVMYTMEATSHSNQPHLVSEGMIPVGSTAKEIGICFLATNLEKSEANAWPSDFVELNPSTWGILAPSSKTYITTQPTSTSTPTPTPTPTETPTPSPTTTTPTTETPKPTTPSTTTQQTGWDTNTLVILVIVVIVIVTVGALITKKRRAKQK